MVVTKKITLDSQGNCHLLDITPRVAEELAGAGVGSGIITVFVPGSTAAVGTTEFEPGLLQDMKQMWDRLIPTDAPYQHDRAWGERNGFAHLRASLLGPSLTIPFSGARMMLGTWQQVILTDFDSRPRRREVILQIIGE